MLTATLENLLNRGLPRSPRAQQLCAELAGRSVLIEVSDIASVLMESNGVALKLRQVPRPSAPAPASGAARSEPAASTAPDARIVGGPFSLLALAGPEPEAPLQRGAVRIEGDTQIAQSFRELLRLLRPDLEEELALVLGDVPAHQIGRFARAAFGWSRKAADTSARNLSEYLSHEQRELVPRNEAEQFLRGVDALREDVDRLAARIEILARR